MMMSSSLGTLSFCMYESCVSKTSPEVPVGVYALLHQGPQGDRGEPGVSGFPGTYGDTGESGQAEKGDRGPS